MEKSLKCGLGRHRLREPWAKLTDAGQISAVRRSRPHFRPEFKVCKSCFDDVVRIYNDKLKSAKNIAMQKRSAMKNGSTSNPSITSSTSSDNTNSTNCNSRIDDSYDRMLNQTPRNPMLQSINSEVEATPRWMTHLQPVPSNKSPIVQTEPVTIDYSDTTDSSSFMLVSQTSSKAVTPSKQMASTSASTRQDSSFMLALQTSSKAVTPSKQMGSTRASTRQDSSFRLASHTSSTRASTRQDSSIRLASHTSSKAVTPSIQMASTRASTREDSRESTEDVAEDDANFISWENQHSPAVLSGARLPHIQPILRRREFQHPDPRVMDIYLAGLTGG